MTTTLEDERARRLAEIADRSADLAALIGADAHRAVEFLDHYFRHVDTADVLDRASDDLLGLVGAHYRLALQRPPATSNVSVGTPRAATDGWSAQGATVVQVVTDDKPFLVDTVSMEVNRQGWTVREVYHPQYVVRRDVTGALLDIVHTAQARRDPQAVEESWMHLELLPTDEHGDLADLEAGLHRVLRDVEEAVEDWAKMRDRAAEVARFLRGGPGELASWLAHDNFTFLGYRRYTLDRDGADGADGAAGSVARPVYRPVPGTGLGILRADTDPEHTFHALEPDVGPDQALVITKDNFRSTVHRPGYLDYIGVRTFDGEGRLTGEHRFLGLFGAAAYTESVTRLPLLRDKAHQLLARSGYDPTSHGAKAIMAVLDGFPRDELFQAAVSELEQVVEKIARLKDRRQVRMFARRDRFDRFVSCLVYIPRDRYTTAVRTRVQQTLLELLHGETADFTVQVSESVLARLHVVVRAPLGRTIPPVDVPAAEAALNRTTRTWNDDFADELAERETDPTYSRLAALLPEGYKEDFSARQALLDLVALSRADGGGEGGPGRPELALYVPDGANDLADLRFKVFTRGRSLSLSEVLPHLSALGVDVIDERPYGLAPMPGTGERSWIYDFGLRVAGGREAATSTWDAAARERFTAAFAASVDGRSEPDGFNALITRAGLSWTQVSVLRAMARYLQQVGTPYSQAYLAACLVANTTITAMLAELFAVRFDPAHDQDQQHRAAQAEELSQRITAALDEVASLDHDKILRFFRRLIMTVIRTNAYRDDRDALVFKLLPRELPGLPEPRPAYEIFVYSARVEGVHLRFGSVARGGLRWSDRAEDYRTEILGLVKAQMVKNTVIVPVGAKGGFFCKRLPDPAVDREAWQAEGVACYRSFINGLLDVTDTITDGRVIPPAQVVRWDDDDPYLVVAADKGTATFSDIANEISVRRGFWLGDAFASGGSAGYDHKKMGITAKGAWASVQRHFREQGRDCQTEDFTCVGVGDMSGDVFGNGMLLSRHIRLVAAFDHRHVFVDPDPDAASSYAERERMFALPRSSWADYDTSLISEGGGVFDRRAKSITVTAPMRRALGLADDVTELAPTELITAVLCSPVDLLWNGGIGTYVKAASETHAQVGDRANDAVRVNGAQVRAGAIGEGGNLGVTQLGRIEYARSGGRVNTDFIDNSAGVDCSDHEVNIKILLAAELERGLTMPARDELLASMTDEVSALVLAHNEDQNLALANALHQSLSMAGVHEDLMRRYEADGQLDRGIEFLPSSAELADRRAAGSGLTGPEAAVLMAYTKIIMAAEVIGTDLPDDPFLADRLITYFPTPLRERYAGAMPAHRLHREIITTVTVNEFVNKAGITCGHRLSAESGASTAEVIRAHLAARRLYGADGLDARIRELDHRVSAEVQTAMRLEVRTLVERATRWLINNRPAPIDITAAVDDLGARVAEVTGVLPAELIGREADRFTERLDRLVRAGVPDDLARAVAVLPEAYGALGIARTAARDGHDVVEVTRMHLRVGELIGLDRLLGRVVDLPRQDRWQTMARAALRDDLHLLHGRLTAQVLAVDGGTGSVDQRLDTWREQRRAQLATVTDMLGSITDAEADMAKVSVGLRLVRSLVGD